MIFAINVHVGIYMYILIYGYFNRPKNGELGTSYRLTREDIKNCQGKSLSPYDRDLPCMFNMADLLANYPMDSSRSFSAQTQSYKQGLSPPIKSMIGNI